MALVLVGATTGVGVVAGVNDDYHTSIFVHHASPLQQLEDLCMKPHFKVITHTLLVPC